MRIFIFLLFALMQTIQAATVSWQPIDETHLNIQINLPASSESSIYKDYISVSVDTPAIKLGQWRSNIEPVSTYDATFKETKQAFNKPFVIELSAEKNQTYRTDTVHLHLSYYDAQQKKMIQELLPLTLTPKKFASEEPHDHDIARAIAIQEVQSAQEQPTLAVGEPEEKQSWAAYIANLIQKAESLTIRIILVMLLGLLMSLTPCIYPMFPITIGILNAQGNRSVFRNFLNALAYIVGIATTFSCLGLLAAFTGHLFGTIMQNLWVILCLVALLLYLAGSMLGLYDMYIPRFMQNNAQAKKGGSLLSAFLFGIMSGTVASPCLSPGLVLLLSIVTALSSLFIGFVLLFAFGIGLGIPLLIIGTFSGSLNVLPRAGMWMIEIKKLFGVIMIGMCFYFLNNIMPWHFLLLIMTITTLMLSAFYFFNARKTSSSIWRLVNNLFGISFIALSTLLASYTFTAWQKTTHIAPTIWRTDYAQARADAITINKKLFIDIGAPFCSLCKAIDAKLLHTNETEKVLQNNFVAVKIDGSDENNQAIIQQLNIKGFPTILIVDPTSQQIIKRWGSELYDVEPTQFIDELQKLA